jgi:ParB family chromosome partitioning protein
MPSEVYHASVPLSNIDSETDTFRITSNREVADLVAAFKRVGLSNPPILKNTDGGYAVVCGFRRVAAARCAGWQSLPARIMPGDTDLLTCALLAISENSIERDLNLIEMSRALTLLQTLIGDKGTLMETAESVGLPGNPSMMEKLLPLCRLPEPLQNGLLSGALALPSVLMLSRLSTETAIVLSEFLSGMKLGLHKQREFIDIIFEISKREECSIESVIASPDIVAIQSDPNTDPPQKTGRIREYLRQRRFPSLTRAQAEFHRLKSQLKLGSHVSLKPPPGFESNRYILSLSFASPVEFEAQRDILGELAKHREFIHLLSSRDPHGQ